MSRESEQKEREQREIERERREPRERDIERERERHRDIERERHIYIYIIYRERERCRDVERERERERDDGGPAETAQMDNSDGQAGHDTHRFYSVWTLEILNQIFGLGPDPLSSERRAKPRNSH